MEHLDDEKLNAWIENSLSENESKESDSHLESCTACRYKADELIALCDRIKNLPKCPAPKSIEKDILKTFRAGKRENSHLTFSIPGYSAIMAGVLAGLLLGYLISPFLQTFSSTGQVLYTDNNMTIENGIDEHYLQHLLADNGGDLW